MADTLTPDLSQSQALTPEQKKSIIIEPQEWSDDFALKVATADFKKAESFRQSNHDRRFKTSDELYLAWVPRRTWEGTKIPRSSVPIFLAFEQIESLLPQVLRNLLSDDAPFDCQPLAGTTLAAAQAVKALLVSQLRDLGQDGSFLTIREIIRRTYKQDLYYGNGICEFGWLMQQIQRSVYDRQAIAKTVMIAHPVTGQPVPVPTGQLEFSVQKRLEQRSINKPLISPTDIRDFYIDPNCGSPSIQDAQFVATRHLKTIRQIKIMGQLQGFQLPDDKTLIELADSKKNTAGDSSKQQAEGYRGNTWQPTQDQSVDPANKQIELIRYFNKDRAVFTLGREKLFYNQCNPYGMINFLGMCYADVPGRFYGLSLCDLVEGDQKLAQSIINARLDELNLLLHPPIVRRQGVMRPTTSKKIHPGVSWEIDGDPGKDVIRMDMGQVNPQAFVEINALENRVQKYTGVTDLAVLGSPASGGNSANRTATGVNAQAQASSVRVGYQVENIEDQFLEPMLYCIFAMDKKFLNPNQVLQIVGKDGQAIQLDPLTVMNADVQFDFQASTRMKTRHAMQSGGLQMVLSTYMAPQFLQELAKTGKTVNVDTFDRLVCDTLNIPQASLTRDLTPQEIQRMQQPSPEQMMELQMQRERMMTMQQQTDSNDETKLIIEVLKKIITPEIAHQVVGMPMPQEIDAKHAPKRLTAGK